MESRWGSGLTYKRASATDNNMALFSTYLVSPKVGWILSFVQNTGGDIKFYSSGSGWQILYTGLLDTTDFYHGVLTVASNGDVSLWINGNQGSTINAPILATTNPLLMGVYEDGTPSVPQTGYYFDGIIDEVGFWSRVLTSVEIEALYSSGTGLTYIKSCTPAGNDQYTQLLIHSDTTDGNTTFTDASDNSITINYTGTVAHSTAQKKFGNSSIKITNALTSYLYMTNSALEITSGPFVFDTWLYSDAWNSVEWNFHIFSSMFATPWHGMQLSLFGDRMAHYLNNDSGSTVSSRRGEAGAGVSSGVWQHVAWVSNGSKLRTFIDAEQIYETDINGDWGNSEKVFRMGNRAGGASVDFYLDEPRFSTGTDRGWFDGFTLPTKPYCDSGPSEPTVALIYPTVPYGSGATTPTFRVSGVVDGYTVGLYRSLGSGCDVFLNYGVASGTTVDIGTSTLTEGLNSIYAKVENDGSNIQSNCSAQGADYLYDTEAAGIDTSTVLILHGDGSGQGFVDSSYTPNTVSPNSQVTQVPPASAGISYPTENSIFENVMYFDGDGDYLSIPDSENWNFGSDSFTIDFWMNLSSLTGWRTIYSQSIDDRNYIMITLNSNGLEFIVKESDAFVVRITQGSTAGWSTGTWYHVAVVRNGFEYDLYRDGISIVSNTDSDTIPNSTASVNIGRNGYVGGLEYIEGYLDEFRISKGIARWTANFTPPVRPYYDLPADPTIVLQNPSTSPGHDNTPTFRISGVQNGYTVGLYQSTGSGCDTILKEAVAAGSSIDITINALTDAGTYSFYAKVESNAVGMASSCSAVGVNYELESNYCTPNDSKTILLIHSDTTIETDSVVDSSDIGHWITKNGDVHHEYGNGVSKFGQSSIYFDGTGDYLSIEDSDDWDFGTDSWTIDMWVWVASYPSWTSMLSTNTSTDSTGSGIIWYLTNNGTMYLYNGYENYNFRSTGVIGTNAWHHVVVGYNTDTNKLFYAIDGVYEEQTPNAVVNLSNNQPLNIGRTADGLFNFTGYIDEVRILKGAAKWTSNFNPPTRRYCGLTCAPNDSNTVFLIQSDSTDGGTNFQDNSSNGHVVNKFAGVHHETTNHLPGFGDTSIAFGGPNTDDILSVPYSSDLDFGTGDFVIDFWIRFEQASMSDNPYIITRKKTGGGTLIRFSWVGNNATDNNMWWIFLGSGDYHKFAWNNSDRESRRWYHVALVRSGTSLRMFIDGKQIGLTTTSTEDVTDTTDLFIGGFDSATDWPRFEGMLDEIRISKGTDRGWNSNFSTPVMSYCDVVAETAFTGPCPTGFIPVPGDAKLGTFDFCVAKYEMKGSSGNISSTASDSPYASISATSAFSECSGMSESGFEAGTFALISNPQWMTIARNVEQVYSNWSSGNVGSGTLARGWSANASSGDSWTNTAVASSTGSSCLYNTGADTCASSGSHVFRRTLTLSNSEEIWDFSGNLWEWVDLNGSDTSYTSGPTSCESNWHEFSTSCTALNVDDYKPTSGFESTQGVGMWWGGTGGAMLRGGSWGNSSGSGAYAVDLPFAASHQGTYTGFRCVYQP